MDEYDQPSENLKSEPVQDDSEQYEGEEDPYINNNENINREGNENNLYPFIEIKKEEEQEHDDSWMVNETSSSSHEDAEITVKSKKLKKTKSKTPKPLKLKAKSSQLTAKSSKLKAKSSKLKAKSSKLKAKPSKSKPNSSKSKSPELKIESPESNTLLSNSKSESSKSKIVSSTSKTVPSKSKIGSSKSKTGSSKSKTGSSKSKSGSSKSKTGSSKSKAISSKSNSYKRDRRVRYSCEKCDLVFHRLYLYKSHLVTHQPDLAVLEYTCPHPNCSRKYLSEGGLKNHLNFHSLNGLLFQCSQCPTNTNFQTQTELEIHELENHNAEISQSDYILRLDSLKRSAKRKKLHKCPQCAMVFGNIRVYKKHLLNHEISDNQNSIELQSECVNDVEKPVVVKPVKNDSDVVRGNTVEVEASQEQSKDINNIIGCEQCPAKFPDVFKLDLHVVRAHGMPAKCSTCDKTFVTAARLFRHQNVHDAPRFKCSHANCNASFREQKSLTFHERKHAGILPYDCPECRKSFQTRPQCVQHRIEAHGHKIASVSQRSKDEAERRRKRRERSSQNMFFCNYSDCDAKFRYQKTLEIHQRKHNGLLPYICPICNEGFQMRQDCYQHRIDVHNQKLSRGIPKVSAQCETCGAVFKKTYTLQRHVIRHHSGEKPFNCDICGKKFALKLDFEVHMKYHSGNFVCEICGRCTKSKGDLVKHNKIHISQLEEPAERKVYPCDLCSKKVHTRIRLIDHRKKHKTTVPYDFERLPFIPLESDGTNSKKKNKKRKREHSEFDHKKNDVQFVHKKPKLLDWTRPIETAQPYQNYSGVNLLNPTVFNPFNVVNSCVNPIDYTQQSIYNTVPQLPQNPQNYISGPNNYPSFSGYVPSDLAINEAINNLLTPINTSASTSSTKQLATSDNHASLNSASVKEIDTPSKENVTYDSDPASPMDFNDACDNSSDLEPENSSPPALVEPNIVKTEVIGQAGTSALKVKDVYSIKKEKDAPLSEKLLELIEKHIGTRVLSIKLARLTTYPCAPCKVQFHKKSLFGTHCRTFQHRNTVRSFQAFGGINSIEGSESGPEINLTCSICKKVFPSKKAVGVHCLKDHPGEKGFPCRICGSAYFTPGDKEKHEKRAHKRQDEYLCLHCNETLPTYELFRKHTATHKSDAKKCYLCSETFPMLKLLIQHCDSAHPGEKAFVCEICGAAYARFRNFRIHRTQSHTSEDLQTMDPNMKWGSQPIKKLSYVRKNEHGESKCEICGKEVRHLSNHMDTHAEQGRHLCDICGKGFKQKSSLLTHKRRHMGDRNVHCQLCEKSFYLMTELRLHAKTHEKNYSCGVCSEKFISERLLRRHSGLHDVMRPYRCPVCGYMYLCKSTLAVHAKKKHGIQDPII